MDQQTEQPDRKRRHALVLAAVLAATVITGGAAITGLNRTASPPVVQAVPALFAPQAPAGWEGD